MQALSRGFCPRVRPGAALRLPCDPDDGRRPPRPHHPAVEAHLVPVRAGPLEDFTAHVPGQGRDAVEALRTSPGCGLVARVALTQAWYERPRQAVVIEPRLNAPPVSFPRRYARFVPS